MTSIADRAQGKGEPSVAVGRNFSLNIHTCSNQTKQTLTEFTVLSNSTENKTPWLHGTSPRLSLPGPRVHGSKYQRDDDGNHTQQGLTNSTSCKEAWPRQLISPRYVFYTSWIAKVCWETVSSETETPHPAGELFKQEGGQLKRAPGSS